MLFRSDGGAVPRTHLSSQPGLSNSTESIESMKALTAAIEAANAQVHGPASQHVTNSTSTITITATAAIVSADSKRERDALRKCLSIGIQVRLARGTNVCSVFRTSMWRESERVGD